VSRIRILVQKFGGTSVSTVERRQQVVGHVGRAITAGYRVAIVMSAMGRRGDRYATDTLLDMLRSDGGSVTPGDDDLMFSCGEMISAAVMSQTLKRAGIPAVDPRVIPEARVLSRVSYAAMHELARFGAKVVHPRALMAAVKSRTPVVVRSTFSETPGTLIGDVADEAPIVGLALLPAMETVVLRPGAINAATRETWEQRRLVFSLCDSGTGELIVGTAEDRLAEMRDALSEVSVEPIRSEGRCCWVSVVGETDALRERHPGWVARFGRQGIATGGYELTDRRCTYVIPEAARVRAAALLHDTLA
jgi:aspartokinase